MSSLSFIPIAISRYSFISNGFSTLPEESVPNTPVYFTVPAAGLYKIAFSSQNGASLEVTTTSTGVVKNYQSIDTYHNEILLFEGDTFRFVFPDVSGIVVTNSSAFQTAFNSVTTIYLYHYSDVALPTDPSSAVDWETQEWGF